MTSLPDIAEALCLAIARGEQDRFKILSFQVAAKLSDRAPERALRIQRAFEFSDRKHQQTPRSLSPLLPLPSIESSHWQPVQPVTRRPWLPATVKQQLDQWSLEQQHASVLTNHGEKVMPLLLVGETGCGKTSTALALAGNRELSSYVTNLPQDIKDGPYGEVYKSYAESGAKPIYRLALGGMLAQWQGETGRTIQQAFNEMTAGALWLVDEIDAISGHRTSDSSSGKDQAHAIGCLLTSLDNVPSDVCLVATSNMRQTMDVAVLRRFTVVTWPTWDELTPEQATAFFISHGGTETSLDVYFPNSYAEAIAIARQQRITRLLEAKNGSNSKS